MFHGWFYSVRPFCWVRLLLLPQGKLSIRIDADRAADVNRALAVAGIYASGLETGSDLESLFLALTSGAPSASSEGTFFGLAGSTPGPPSGPAGWQGGGDAT